MIYSYLPICVRKTDNFVNKEALYALKVYIDCRQLEIFESSQVFSETIRLRQKFGSTRFQQDRLVTDMRQSGSLQRSETQIKIP